jgi:hypothetical protein
LKGVGSSNEKFSLDFGFLDEKSLSRHFGEKNKVFSPFEYTVCIWALLPSFLQNGTSPLDLR